MLRTPFLSYIASPGILMCAAAAAGRESNRCGIRNLDRLTAIAMDHPRNRTPRLRRLLLLLCLLAYALPAGAQFYTLETANLHVVYYDQGISYLLPHVGRCFENSLRFHQALFHYTPSEPVTVFLTDLNDYGSGGTNSIPWDYLSIGIEPFDYVYETCPTNERINWVMHHEIAHLVDLDKPAGSDRTFRSLFAGKVAASAENPISMLYSFLTSPRYYSPRWYHEGMAVFLETWMAGGIGRTLGGYDEMVFRAMVRDSTHFYDFVGLESEGKTIDFQIGANSYLYGTRFISYLAVLPGGPERVLQWFERGEGTDRYFASEFERLYGLPLDEAWSDWIAFEHRWQRENLDSLGRYPLTPERPLGATGALGSVSRAFFDSSAGAVYLAVNYPGKIARAVAIRRADGAVTDLCEIPTPALYYVSSLAYDDSLKKLFFTTHNGYAWRDLNVVDVRSGESTLLIKDGRTGDLAFNRADRSLYGVRHNKGYSTLVRIPPPYNQIYEVQTLQYGKDLFDLDVSPDGAALVASSIEVSGRQQLLKLNLSRLLAGESNAEVLYEFENNAPENFVFSPDGKYLYGTSYYTGVSNVFRYSFQTGKMEALSNCETGYFRPLPLPSGDSLLVFRYTGGSGFRPVVIPVEVREDLSPVKYLGEQIVEKHPVVKSWKVGSPLAINIDSLTTYAGPYSGLSRLRLASVYPVVQGYKSVAAYGLRFNLADPAGLHSLDLTGAYSPQRSLGSGERIHLAMNYRYWQWKVNAAYNVSDFYDLFGPTKTSRKGYSASVAYSDYFFYDKPRTFQYTLRAAGYGGLERLPEFQNVATTFDRFATFDAGMKYKYLLRPIGSVDFEKGLQWELSSSTTLVNPTAYPRALLGLDYGFMLPPDHLSLWLRSSAGYSHGNRTEPLANFYFGGFGNNWVDYQDVQRYRAWYSFPGLALNELGGTTFGKLLAELSLPPLRFQRAGIPNFYCTWAHLTLFSSGIAANFDDRATRRSLFDLGAQADFAFVLFTNLESTFSVGYAAAFERAQRTKRELMLSLKIL